MEVNSRKGGSLNPGRNKKPRAAGPAADERAAAHALKHE